MSYKEIFDSIPSRYDELRGKVAVVTGSSRGIGKGIAYRLAKEGMKIVVTSRTAAAVEQTAGELSSFGVEVCPVVADMSTDEGIDTTGGQDNQVFDNYFSCLLPVPANGDLDDLCSAAASDSWLNCHCLDGDTVTNPT